MFDGVGDAMEGVGEEGVGFGVFGLPGGVIGEDCDFAHRFLSF